MAEPPKGTQAQNSGDLVIPDDIREKYADLIELILSSESMNNEERQYWINILPIMTPDQIENLQGILKNEKKQLEAIDKKYSKQIEQMGQEELVRRTETQRRSVRTKRESAEAKHDQQDDVQAEELLKQIEGF